MDVPVFPPVFPCPRISPYFRGGVSEIESLCHAPRVDSVQRVVGDVGIAVPGLRILSDQPPIPSKQAKDGSHRAQNSTECQQQQVGAGLPAKQGHP
jgi:hypothetical protein